MKSQRDKRVHTEREKRSAAAQAARESSPALMQVYQMFLPAYHDKGVGKYTDDKYGNRVLRKAGAKK